MGREFADGLIEDGREFLPVGVAGSGIRNLLHGVGLLFPGAAAALGLGAWRVHTEEMSLMGLLIILMLGIEVFRPLRDLRVVLHVV